MAANAMGFLVESWISQEILAVSDKTLRLHPDEHSQQHHNAVGNILGVGVDAQQHHRVTEHGNENASQRP